MVVRGGAGSPPKAPPNVFETRRPGLARDTVAAYRVQDEGDGVVAAGPTPGSAPWPRSLVQNDEDGP